MNESQPMSAVPQQPPRITAAQIAKERRQVPAAAAKARLLAWASDSDTTRAAGRSSVITLATGGFAALAFGLIVSRLLRGRVRPSTVAGKQTVVTTVGKRLVSMALVIRLAKWLLPLLLKRFMK